MTKAEQTYLQALNQDGKLSDDMQSAMRQHANEFSEWTVKNGWTSSFYKDEVTWLQHIIGNPIPIRKTTSELYDLFNKKPEENETE